MGVFDALPKDGSSMKANDLAGQVNADPALLSMTIVFENSISVADRYGSSSHAMRNLRWTIRRDCPRRICSYALFPDLPSSGNSWSNKVDVSRNLSSELKQS
jgi:hypothetical protein